MKKLLVALMMLSLVGCATVNAETKPAISIEESTEETKSKDIEIEYCDIKFNGKTLRMEDATLGDFKDIFGEPVESLAEGEGYYNKFKVGVNGNELVVPSLEKEDECKVDYFTLNYSSDADNFENTVILEEITPQDTLEAVIGKLGQPDNIEDTTEFPTYFWEIGEYTLDVTFNQDKPWMLGLNKRLGQ